MWNKSIGLIIFLKIAYALTTEDEITGIISENKYIEKCN